MEVQTAGKSPLAPQSHELLRAGDVLERYQIVRLLGQGGMGAVYEAVHTGLNKHFALKTLLPALVSVAGMHARFVREAEASSRINHPNVVSVVDVGTAKGIPYFVMELLQGESLAELLRRRGRLEVVEALGILLPVIWGVAAGHDKAVVHRDLKPHNILLTRGLWEEWVPKVLDFGVSKVIDGDGDRLTNTSALLGTANYMSPEQARGAREIDGRSDQYSLALILYELLAGRMAQPGEHVLEVIHNVATGTIIPISDLRPDLPVPLIVALMRALMTSPEERYPSLRAFADALLPYIAAGGGRAPQDVVHLVEGAFPRVGSTRLLPAWTNGEPTTVGGASAELFRRRRPFRGPRRVVAMATVGTATLLTAASFFLLGGAPRLERGLTSNKVAVSPALDLLPSPSTSESALPPLASLGGSGSVSAPATSSMQASASPAEAPLRTSLLPPPMGKRHPTVVAKRGKSFVDENPKREPVEPAARPALASPKPDCTQNFYLDAQGEKHFKPQCF